MFHFKDFRRRNVSESPYLSSRVLESSSTPNDYDSINEPHIPAHHVHNHFPANGHPHHTASSHDDSEVEDILAPGDIIGKGSLLRGDTVSLLPTDRDSPDDDDQDEQFQVIDLLGKGSYAAVYLVHQVFFTPSHGPSAPKSASSRGRSNTQSSDDAQILGYMDTDDPLADPTHQPIKTYGRKFAIKCLSKAREELDIQMTEVTIHQSLPFHSNIVALHKTLQTSSYLLLVLEYVPGEDLFYFLEQAKDHYTSPALSPMPSPMLFSPSYPISDPPESLSQQMLLQQQHTPPSPSLLSSLHPLHLLCRTRLRLIASMFGQMCDAVAACHAVGVFHRDIKPENFIVTDGRYLDDGKDGINGGKNQGRVVVKLTDFGLSTREEVCSDLNCGSAPYMSYECRNNIAPTYRPREADVWSLGIVLINMLYHKNPWTDTADGACPSFTAFRQNPVSFFMRYFAGMTYGFAEVLARGVFCVDDEQSMVNGRLKEKRMAAAELGEWVRNSLVDLLATDEGVTLGSAGASSVIVKGGHKLSPQMRISHRPVSRAASPFGGIGSTVATPRILGMTLSRAPSLAPALEKEEGEIEAKRGWNVQIVEELQEERQEQEQEEIDQTAATPSSSSRTSTTTKRRKRGYRGKGAAMKQQDHQQQDETLKTLADASQSLAREISNATKVPSFHRLQQQQQQQPPSSWTSVSDHNHVNGDDRRLSSVSTLSSTFSGDNGTSNMSDDTVMSESGSEESNATVVTVATTVPPSIMSMSTGTAGTTMTTTSSISSADSSSSTRTVSKASSSRTATTSSGSSINSRLSRRYEPLSMYALPTALLSKPMAEKGTRTPSRLSTSSGTAPSVGSGSKPQSQHQQQPNTVAKKPSKWTLRFGKNNSGGGGNNATFATSATTSNPAPSVDASAAAAPSAPAPASTSAPSTTPDQVRSPIRRPGTSPPICIPIGGPGHVITFAAPSAPASDQAKAPIGKQATPMQNVVSFAASSASSASIPSRRRSRPMPIPVGGPGHVVAFPAPVRTAPTQATMSDTVTNVTNVLNGLNPASSQSHFQQNGNSVAGKGYSSSTTWNRGAGGGRSPYKSPSRSPGLDGPSRTVGFGSSASSSNASLISGASSWMDLGQGQGRSQDGWDKWTSDRMGLGSRGIDYKGGRGVAETPGGAMRLTSFGAGGGRHGSVGAVGGPFASVAYSAIGTGTESGESWRAGNTNMNPSASGSGIGGASLHGSVSASGTASPGGSTSAFTRSSNSSLRSVSTTATSVSSGSKKPNWRSGGGRGGAAVAMAASAFSDPNGLNLPKSVQIIDGIPLAELPRGQNPNPDVGPPARKVRSKNKKGNNKNANGATSTTATIATSEDSSNGDLNTNKITHKLDTIIERPPIVGPVSDLSNGQQEDATGTNMGSITGDDGPDSRKDAMASKTDLVAGVNTSVANDEGAGGRVKKLHKGQIHTLAKMLSALRR